MLAMRERKRSAMSEMCEIKDTKLSRYMGFSGLMLPLTVAVTSFLQTGDRMSMTIYTMLTFVPTVATIWFSFLLLKNKDKTQLLPLYKSLFKSFQSFYAISIAATAMFALFPDARSVSQFQQALVPIVLGCGLYAAPCFYFMHKVHQFESLA